jgi:branched-chain amino acid transport system substrate-binding protein
MLLILCTACANTPTAAVAQDQIKIGLITPLSGSLASLGETAQQAVTLAVDEINSAGGINGKPLKLIIEDSKGEMPAAVSAAHKLIEVDKVPVLLEGASSGEAAAIAPIAQEAGVIHISIFSTTESLVDAGDFVFKMREGALPHAEAIIQVMKDKSFSNISILHLNDEYCTNAVSQFKKQANISGIDIVSIEKYSSEDTDVRTQIIKIKNSSPKGVYVCGFYMDLGLVFKQLYETNINKQLFSITTFEHPLVKENAGLDAIEGTIYSVSPLDCAKSKGFCERFNSRFEKKPDYRSAFAYDAMHAVAKALMQSSDPAKLKGILLTITLEGATGNTSFDDKGNAVKDVIVHQVKDGKWANYP